MSSKTSANPNSPTQDEPLIMKNIPFYPLEIDALTPRTPLLNIEETLTYPTNFFSDITYFWIFKTLRLAVHSPLSLDNLGRIASFFNAKNFFSQLKPKWYEKYQYKNRGKLFRAVLRANLGDIIKMLTLTIIQALIKIGNIYIYRHILLTFSSSPTDTPVMPLTYLIVLMLTTFFFNNFMNRRSDFLVSVIGSKTILQINALIYDKLLRVATYNKSSFSEGELVNYIQIDSEKFGEFLSDSPKTIIFPFQLVFYVTLLFQYFGPSFLFGLGCLIGMQFLLWCLQKKKLSLQKMYMKAKDERMKITTQTFNIIKTIKLYSWENAFIAKIKKKREEEIELLRQTNSLFATINGVYWSGTIILSVVSISFYNFFGNTMDTANILTSILIFNNLADPIFVLPSFINGLFDSFVSLKRIEKFLFAEDNDTSQVEILPSNSSSAISISNCSFGIDKTAAKPIKLLHDITLDIKKGEIVGVVGEVGSGKSCLLNAILNNLAVFSSNEHNNIKLNGTISYVSQNPWILNDTVRNNILFFKEMNEDKYRKVIEICELAQDIKLFPGGDMTEIGEKGIGLSGGQKARLAIARALYSDADIYLFDDPLSALDAYVGMKIFNQVFMEYLKDKTRIIVTHALQYVSYTDRVIYMHEGRIKWFGTSVELNTQEFYQNFIKNIENKKKKNNNIMISNKEEENSNNLDKNNTEIVRLTKDEKQRKGNITMKVWWTFYLYAGGLCYLLAMIFVNIMWKASEVVSDLFLTYWTGLNTQSNTYIFLIIYTAIAVIVTIFVFARAYLMVAGLIAFNKRMHDELLEKLIKAPVNLFHDTIPRGQILSRLSKDLENSTYLTNISNGTLLVMFQLIGCVVVCGMFNPYTLIVMPFIFAIELAFIRFYLHGGRDLNRLEGNIRSPMIGVFSETISGVPIIRAYHFENNFTDKFYSKLNGFFKVKLFQSGGSNWFGLQLDMISFVLLLFILVFSLYFKDTISPESMGLLLSYSIKLMDYLHGIMNRLILLERLLTSVERCVGFTKVIQERPSNTEIDKENPNFPFSGSISFKNFSARYRPETELVLKNISFDIKPGEKVGVVGRTGSGKSTMCLCLFRIIEANSGSISIDDIDISKLGLEYLRENLTIIPQEPTLIQGTLRENVDPGNKYTDDEIINAFNEVGLDYLIKSKGINYVIVENGNNLSIGEKQLLCIARAMLRKSKVVLMDEATSSIDYSTETLIQNSISKVLKNSTVITIAHRIKTIINYDRILVLANGEIVEYDTPEKLLQNKNGLFSELYKESAI